MDYDGHLSEVCAREHMYGIKLCVFTAVFLCCAGGKWQMSGSRVGLSAPHKPCCYILEVLPRSTSRCKIPRWMVLAVLR